GTYAVCLHFDDGHNTGIYSWDWLHELANNHARLCEQYLDRLAKAGHTRKIV
ncbi:MAG: gamma-butyrobetaine hydroxylase-like domain-containing protein, partial [Pseudomonadota bacterium]